MSAESPAPAAPLIPLAADTLDDEWDNRLVWSYGPRLWNVGCG